MRLSETFECLDHGLGNLLLRAEFAVHVVEGKKEGASVPGAVIAERLCVEAVGFTHETTKSVAVHCVFEKRFGCPNEHLRGSLHVVKSLISNAERVGYKTLAVLVQGGNAEFSTQMF